MYLFQRLNFYLLFFSKFTVSFIHHDKLLKSNSLHRKNISNYPSNSCLNPRIRNKGSCFILESQTGLMEQSESETVNPLVQIAPMLDVTYREFRQFMRLLTQKSQLWTEMFTASALVHAPETVVSDWLKFGSNENPIVAQLGGNCIDTLIQAGRLLKNHGYTELNLNVGCPSPRVSGKGCFGAALMKTKELVRDIVHTLRRELELEVSVKHRLGVDNLDSYEFVKDFVSTVSESGCNHFIVHSRKAWLRGVNPKQNRKVPPLEYEKVYRLQRDFPDLKFTINGGFKTIEDIKNALDSENKDSHGVSHSLNGVMVGRATYENPCMLANVDKAIYGVENPPTCATRRILLESYADYIDKNVDDTHEMNICMIVKPILGVFYGEYGNRIYRQTLSNSADYENFTFDVGESRHAQFIHHAIYVMDRINPESLNAPLY
ncbi:tRNA-dihydrouridine synthase, putative [Theileria equi strain WA]|uniref:tRNA-dihydrouridine synthase, putative n=1 Tax=Theileria equi strain WA TaxID=1537102 RepID=L0AYE6_THEEQ|nr:tRNA-dihydrouridine synthase, putative [Theileria equi strain WA]AFZ80590.1 tRNA-dihydrouridine synthase, putative [Theileria equi strain WA]|eukprot:XP_004830256.1 tRNA-dihydrouridine synthase, putative [Theileria equi strain WA]